MRNWFSSNPLGVNHRSILATWAADAEIHIGERVGLTGATICAQTSITIGNDVRIGANSTIIDTDFHPIDPEQRLITPTQGASQPIVIGDNVFIGMHAILLKNTTIGEGSVVGAGSVVAGQFPSRVVIAGNPARIIKEL